MKKTIILILFLLLGAVLADGQYPSTLDYGNWVRRREESRMNQQFEILRRISETNSAANQSYVTVSTTSHELEIKAKQYLKTDASIAARYQDFLQSPKTGLTTLWSERLCLETQTRAKIKLEKLIQSCPFTFIPGGGGFFSFRQKSYVNYALADIGFKDNLIFSLGSLNQGIFVDLGDVKIEDLAENSKGVDYLFKYVPATTLEGAAEDSARFEAGLKVDDSIYKNVVTFKTDRTYGLRVVAYQPYAISLDKTDKKEIRSYYLKEDIRQDIIVVFRIVGKSAGGDIVLLWKELRRAHAPEILVVKPKSNGQARGQ